MKDELNNLRIAIENCKEQFDIAMKAAKEAVAIAKQELTRPLTKEELEERDSQ